VKLEKLNIQGIEDIYLISNVKKEFAKAVSEEWKENPPWERYHKKLAIDLAVLDQEKERAIDLPHFEKLSGEDDLYSIRHPEASKNIRVIYGFVDEYIILLTAFIENNDGDYKRAISVAKLRLRWLKS